MKAIKNLNYSYGINLDKNKNSVLLIRVEFYLILRSFIRGSLGVIFLYDITKLSTFEKIKEIIASTKLKF